MGISEGVGQVCPGGEYTRGVGIYIHPRHGTWDNHTPPTVATTTHTVGKRSWQAGGTHSTGMLSCIQIQRWLSSLVDQYQWKEFCSSKYKMIT